MSQEPKIKQIIHLSK